MVMNTSFILFKLPLIPIIFLVKPLGTIDTLLKQNGMVKCNNRHLIETTQILLYHGRAPY